MNVSDLFAFTSNAEAGNFLFFGQKIDALMNYTLVFFAFTSIAFIGTWLSGLILESKSDGSTK